MKFTSWLACAAVMIGLMATPSGAAVKYWDINGSAPGSGSEFANDLWDLTSNNWSTSAAGDVETTTWQAGDEAVFTAGNSPFDLQATMIANNPLGEVLDPASVTINSGRLILQLGGTSANTQLRIGSNPIRVNEGGTLQISSNLVIAAGQNHVLTLDGGTLRNTIIGVGSGIYTSPNPSATAGPTRIELTSKGGTLNTPNGGLVDGDDVNGAYSIMVYGTAASAAVVGMSPGTTSATLRKTGHGELRALNNWTFTELDVQQGLYRINGSGGGETGFGAPTGTVRTSGGAVENSTSGAALGTSAGLTAANASPTTRSFILGNDGGTPDTMFVLNASWDINGPISGPGGLMLNGWARNDGSNGTGTTSIIGTQTPILALGGTNTYAGNTTINFGTILARGGNAIPNTSRVVFSTRSDWGQTQGGGTTSTFNTAILRVDASETVGSISGGNATRGVVNINGAAVVLSTGADNTSSTFGGAIQGTGGLTKVGSGTFSMTGTNTYSGDTRVNGGTLSSSVSTSLADAADVYLTTGSFLNLNFAGTDTIDSLFIDGVGQATGTWGAMSNALAANKTPLITGTGLLNVTTPATPSNNADFNDDGTVNGADFLIWQRGFGLTGQTDKSNGNANTDTVVDGLDYTEWASKFGGPPVPALAAAAGVPEPASACLVAMALAALAGVRRRVA